MVWTGWDIVEFWFMNNPGSGFGAKNELLR